MVRRLKPDVVLLDYAMPEMNGVEAAREIATIAPECAVLLFTMYASEQLAELAYSVGVRAVVSKDVGGMRALIDAIEKIGRNAA